MENLHKFTKALEKQKKKFMKNELFLGKISFLQNREIFTRCSYIITFYRTPNFQYIFTLSELFIGIVIILLGQKLETSIYSQQYYNVIHK